VLHWPIQSNLLLHKHPLLVRWPLSVVLLSQRIILKVILLDGAFSVEARNTPQSNVPPPHISSALMATGHCQMGRRSVTRSTESPAAQALPTLAPLNMHAPSVVPPTGRETAVKREDLLRIVTPLRWRAWEESLIKAGLEKAFMDVPKGIHGCSERHSWMFRKASMMDLILV
jgi:hypothetical protein